MSWGHTRGRRIAAWTAGAVLALLLLAGLGLWWALRSGSLHQYLLRAARAKATAAVGSKVAIGDFSLHLTGLSPSLDLYDVVVAGAPPATNPPLLRVDHIHVGIRITSLWHRAWHLSDLEVDHPVVWFLNDAQGHTNLPPAGAGPGLDVFDLGVGRATLARGEITVNHRPRRIEASLRGVTFQARFDRLHRRYAGHFGYSDGELRYENYRPIPHALAVDFAATAAGIEVSRLTLTSGATRLEASGSVRDYARPQISARYQLSLDATQARAIFRAPALPSGMIAVTGTANYGAGGASGLEAVEAEGSFSSAALAVTVGEFATPVRALAGRYRLAQGNLALSDVRAGVLGGQARVTLSIRDLATTAAARLQAQLAGARLERAARFAGPAATTLGAAGIAGTVSGAAEASWQGGFEHFALSANATLAAALASAAANATAQGPPLPLNGAVHLRYGDGELTLVNTSLTAPATTITANGTVAVSGSRTAALQVRLQASDLHELETIADRVRLGLGGAPLPPLGLYGVGSFAGSVAGSLQAPRIAGEIAAAGLRLRGTAWRSAGARIVASAEQVSLTQGELAAASGGHVTIAAAVGLQQWQFRPASPLHVNLEATGLPLQPLAQILGRPSPISGVLTAQLALHGSARDLVGTGHASVADAVVASGSVREPLEALTATFSGTGQEIQAQLEATAPAGKLQASGTYNPQAETYTAQAQASGLRLDRLRTAVARGLPVAGAVSFEAHGQGSLANPELEATLSAAALVIERETFTGLRLQAGVANHTLQVTLASQAVGTTLRGQATVALSGDYEATATLDTQTLPLAPLLAVYAPALAGQVAGETEIHATLRGPLRRISALQAQVTVPVLRLSRGRNLTLAAAAPLRLALANGLLTLQPAQFTGTNTQLQLGGTIAVAGPEAARAPLKLQASGTVDLALARAFVPDLAAAGQLQLRLAASGALAAPALTGEIQVVNASLATAALPVGLQAMNGVLRLEGNRLEVENLKGSVGGGAVTASGGIVFGPEAPGGLQFSLGLAARQVHLLYPANVREELGADLTLTGNRNAAFLNGAVRLENVSVTPQFDLANFIGQMSGSAVMVAAPGSFTQDLALNIALTTPNQINTASPGFSLEANANLTVRGTAAEPVLLGRLNLTNGDLIFRGNRFVISSGTLDFVNPTQTQPVVNLAADTTIQQYNLHLRFQGPASNLQTAYSSDPPLPPADIINLLAFGQTSTASSANPTSGNLGAENLIASAVSSQITDRVQKIAGISQLSVNPVLGGGNQQNAGARITVQQRVTGNLFVTLSSDVTSTQRQVIEIQYKLTPKVSVSAVRDQNGGVGVNASFKKIW